MNALDTRIGSLDASNTRTTHGWGVVGCGFGGSMAFGGFVPVAHWAAIYQMAHLRALAATAAAQAQSQTQPGRRRYRPESFVTLN